MSDGLPETWQRLEVGYPTGEQLLARIAIPDVTPRLHCALDVDRRRHLLIRLDDAEKDYVDTQSRGLTVETRELVVRGQDRGRYLDIQCGDATGHTIFDVVATDLASNLAKRALEPADVVQRVLARWRRFWTQQPQSLLSREEQLGLFAELWFLDVWLRPRFGMTDSLGRWHGPSGSRHDFSWSIKAVEVKATTSSRGRIFKINGLDQLVPPNNGTLYLFGMRLLEDTGASNSLPSLVSRLRENLAAEPDALGRFESLLALAGYFTAFEKEYDNLRLTVREEALFAVTDDFPRLTSQEFRHGIPAGVERVEYEINLNGFNQLSIVGEAEIRLSLAP